MDAQNANSKNSDLHLEGLVNQGNITITDISIHDPPAGNSSCTPCHQCKQACLEWGAWLLCQLLCTKDSLPHLHLAWDGMKNN